MAKPDSHVTSFAAIIDAIGARPHDTIDATLDWLEERKENCIRIGSTKSGADREGWIEDGAKFGHAISLIKRAYR